MARGDPLNGGCGWGQRARATAYPRPSRMSTPAFSHPAPLISCPCLPGCVQQEVSGTGASDRGRPSRAQSTVEGSERSGSRWMEAALPLRDSKHVFISVFHTHSFASSSLFPKLLTLSPEDFGSPRPGTVGVRHSISLSRQSEQATKLH